MATIKSYTSLEQSKKLAEILPLESADMSYSFNFDSEIYEISTTSYRSWVVPKYAQPDNGFGQIIPCWSLAALFDVIPQEILDGEYVINITEGSDNRWVLTYDHFENRNHSYFGLSTGDDNLIDACYEMIIHLYELKML